MARVDVTLVVRDAAGGVSAPKSVEVIVNDPPIIDGVTVDPPTVAPGGQAIITILAHDPEGDALTYEATASAGTITPGPGPNQFTFRAP